jgi:tRNA1(Val) A37 N6-methylase TrmN6
MPDSGRDDLTDDAALGGRLRLLQPRRGHRFGHDAILLAAATPAGSGERAADLGAGVGAAGLALAARVAGVRVSLVEIDVALAAIAAVNIARNGLADRVAAVTLDVVALAPAFARAGLAAASCDAVLMNPPFHDPQRNRVSPDPRRRLAHTAGSLDGWIGAAARLLRRDGALTLIFRADAVAEILAASERAFGAIAVMPVYPKPDTSAVRVLVGAIKGSRAPLAIRPGLVLAAADGTASREAEAVLRHAAALPLRV